ncbi:PRC-barrel domain-containing protein [Sphingosinicellaceae bacterium]|nr:PRC-barrel domain-containing protein [Sphingosinicellaceae bacterium]
MGGRDTETDLTTGRDYESADTAGLSGRDPSAREFGDNIDGLGRDQTDRVTADETGTLISADKVQGTAVYDGNGERLGTIDSLMLNKRSGKVAYAVMSFGGFLGIGERYHPLPWDKLTYDMDKGGYNVGATQDELRSGPTYTRDELDDFGDNGRRDEVDDYYGGSALDGGITRSGGIPIV